MTDRSLPFDHPEVRSVFEVTLGVLVAESDRGAILIGAELLNNALEGLLRSFMPSKTTGDALLKYPGPLTSLASRSDAAYAFRLAGSNVHVAANLLRKVRNHAAHSPAQFTLNAYSDELARAYAEIASPPGAFDGAANQFIALKLFHAVHDDDDGTWARSYELGLFTGPDDVLLRMAQAEQLEEYVPKFRLAAAISVLCALIMHYRLELLEALPRRTPLVLALRAKTSPPSDSVEAASADDATRPGSSNG